MKGGKKRRDHVYPYVYLVWLQFTHVQCNDVVWVFLQLCSECWAPHPNMHGEHTSMASSIYGFNGYKGFNKEVMYASSSSLRSVKKTTKNLHTFGQPSTISHPRTLKGPPQQYHYRGGRAPVCGQLIKQLSGPEKRITLI